MRALARRRLRREARPGGRRIRVRRDLDGKTIDGIANDMKRSSAALARLYKFRWRSNCKSSWR